MGPHASNLTSTLMQLTLASFGGQPARNPFKKSPGLNPWTLDNLQYEPSVLELFLSWTEWVWVRVSSIYIAMQGLSCGYNAQANCVSIFLKCCFWSGLPWCHLPNEPYNHRHNNARKKLERQKQNSREDVNDLRWAMNAWQCSSGWMHGDSCVKQTSIASQNAARV